MKDSFRVLLVTERLSYGSGDDYLSTVKLTHGEDVKGRNIVAVSLADLCNPAPCEWCEALLKRMLSRVGR